MCCLKAVEIYRATCACQVRKGEASEIAARALAQAIKHVRRDGRMLLEIARDGEAGRMHALHNWGKICQHNVTYIATAAVRAQPLLCGEVGDGGALPAEETSMVD
eukprot:6192864-Pleurochrysis_carterae.AAC.1